ncbi:UDP-N-acetylmuramoylalanyl-D-glutamate--2,6-diaminopimelate ligase [Albidovulum inexpectatum]|uniref:UDP-N-acetylmuramoyl-L-alanyl-D-glutamate--2,6-diaminopimelate ligase n=1 Tax=Albidovulum inexpectatum TaxID=196587 RepID=A0A2S5JI34_9RHOB|nr:UDP-N-acetylmuramoyl-L-alanyl-D-glutamate--2,6-diaminopimelate ligase [Albidovulum inexpectatum]PPB81123.1 UDP-N-acetylmuramoylalanyl-D-glutamate--2,6-diaminopimelate ligase [Albidovulum inexpectatum]
MAETKTLAELGLTAQGGREARITGLSVDSRQVRPGHLFAALPGSTMHGGEFIQYALRMGAAAILTDREGARIARDALAGADAALIVSEDPRQALACAAALWFGAQPETMVAVTGTSGKTSVATFTRQIWQALGHSAINLGTMGVLGDFEAPLAHTTPEPITLHRVLADAAQAGITHAAMEASSHGLDQRRLDGVRLQAAAFTNFSQDHLDYHETFEAYFAAKAGLFDRVLPKDGMAVVNIDDPRGREILEIARARGQQVITVGRNPAADLSIAAQRFDATGQDLRFMWKGQPHLVRLALIGGFQAENVLAAAGLAIATGDEPARVFATLPGLTTVRGRMQLVARRDNGATVFVDYSHKPGALAAALQSLRPHVMGRIVVVFGAGGDRDRSKRPLMGEVAAKHADLVIVTDDNPRTEDPASIRAEVMAGCPEAIEVPDRAEAILRGVDALLPGDALLIAGKGHETGQIIGHDVYPFDDAEQASVAVAALEGRI